jgi:hypothetical protein
MITDDFLKTAVGLRVDAGVSASKIEKLIQRYTSGPPGQAPAGDLPWHGTEDVPQNCREDLLVALAEMSPEPDYSPGDGGRIMSAMDVWPCRIEEEAKMHRSAARRQTATDFLAARDPAPQSDAIDADNPDRTSAPVEENKHGEVDKEQQVLENGDRIVPSDSAVSAPLRAVDRMTGGIMIWDPAELERIKNEIKSRRDDILSKHAQELKEIFSRHAAELKALDTDDAELDAFEQAIDAMSRRFKPPSFDNVATGNE